MPLGPRFLRLYTYEIVSILLYYLIKCIIGSWTVPNMVATLLFIVYLIQTEAACAIVASVVGRGDYEIFACLFKMHDVDYKALVH